MNDLRERPMTERPKNVLSLFERTLTLAPERIALLDGDRSSSYSDLAAKAGRIAARLQAAGAGPDRTVGLCLERSTELIRSVLGILRSGAAYTPIDPTYPAERISVMLEDAKPPVVITIKAHQHLFKGTKTKVLLIEDIDLENGPLFEGPARPNPTTCLRPLHQRQHRPTERRGHAPCTAHEPDPVATAHFGVEGR
jgi:non-ribosomal peptide synthetase component F